MKEKFIVQYVPQERVEELEREYETQMAVDGLTSIWDIADMAGHEDSFEFETMEEAESKAREVLPFDHFGQVVLYREVYVGDDCPEWEPVEQAFLTGEDEPIEWEKC